MDSQPARKRLILLVLRAQSGDRAALDRLLESCQAELYGYLMKMLRNHADAEDALQVTLLQIAKKIRWLRDPAFFRAWTFRIASRVAFGIIRQQKKQHEFYDPELIEASIPEPTADVAHLVLLERIPEWLDKLTPKGREAIVLHYIEGFTAEEISQILGIPVGTVKSRVSYSLACIRKQISPNFDSSPAPTRPVSTSPVTTNSTSTNRLRSGTEPGSDSEPGTIEPGPIEPGPIEP